MLTHMNNIQGEAKKLGRKRWDDAEKDMGEESKELAKQEKPEDQWSCKRSPEICYICQ